MMNARINIKVDLMNIFVEIKKGVCLIVGHNVAQIVSTPCREPLLYSIIVTH